MPRGIQRTQKEIEDITKIIENGMRNNKTYSNIATDIGIGFTRYMVIDFIQQHNIDRNLKYSNKNNKL